MIIKNIKNKLVRLFWVMLLLMLNIAVFSGTPISIESKTIRFVSADLLILGDGIPNNTDHSEYFSYYLSESQNIDNYVSINLKSNYNGPIILIITAQQTGNGFGNINYFNDDCYISSIGGTTFYLTPDGNIPNTISKHEFYWNWTITIIPKCENAQYDACTHAFNTHHCCYVLWDTPLEPMDEPWVGVLDKAVEFAGGAYEYENEVIEALTTNLYSSKAWYNGGIHFTTGNSNFNLSSLLIHWDSLSIVEMDCRDFANFLHVLANALGIECVFYKINLDISLSLNCLKPSGWSGDGITCSTKWNFHQFAWCDSMVVDASTMIDIDSNPTGSSPYHIWALAKGDMSLTFYLDKLAEYNISTGITGQCEPY
jgi:hypothetical protein